MPGVKEHPPANPFVSQGSYSPEAVELMRAMSSMRQRTRQTKSTPHQVLTAIRELGYESDEQQSHSELDQIRSFMLALQRYQNANAVNHPTCEDVIAVLRQMGYRRGVGITDEATGLPIDRRRREFDERGEQIERRASSSLSVQEELQLSELEHRFLDALKDLRQSTGREFASSEELLSIVWDLGFRPVTEFGQIVAWLDNDERCELQQKFSAEVERTIAKSQEESFLTCRNLLQIVEGLGLQRL